MPANGESFVTVDLLKVLVTTQSTVVDRETFVLTPVPIITVSVRKTADIVLYTNRGGTNCERFGGFVGLKRVNLAGEKLGL